MDYMSEINTAYTSNRSNDNQLAQETISTFGDAYVQNITVSNSHHESCRNLFDQNTKLLQILPYR